MNKFQKAVKSGKFKYGSLSIVVIVLFLAFVVLLNLIVGSLSDTYNLRLDLTSGGLFKISNESKDYLKSLGNTVEIIILADEDTVRSSQYREGSMSPLQYMAEVSDNFVAAGGGKVTLTFIDPDYQPKYLTDRKIEITESDLVVVYSPETKRYRTVTVSSFSDLQYTLFERSLLSCVLYAAKESIDTIGFVSNHGETTSAYLAATLRDNGYDVVSVDLSAVESLTSNPSLKMLIVVNPNRDFSVTDIDKIDEFLQNGGNYGNHLVVIGDTNMPTLSRLESYLADEWAVSFGKETILDTSKNISTSLKLLKINYADTDSVGFSSKLVASNIPIRSELGTTRPVINLLGDSGATRDDMSVVSLLASTDTSFARVIKTSLADSDFEKKDTDAVGPFTIALLSYKLRYEEITPITSSVFISGSNSFANDYFVGDLQGTAGPATADFFLNYVQYAVNVKDQISVNVRSVNLTSAALNITSDSQIYIIGGITIIGIPLVFAIVAIIVGLRRKHL